MAAKGILVDSSLIIDFIRKKNKQKSVLYNLFQQGHNLVVSVFTYYELLCGARKKELQIDTENILSLFEIVDFHIIEAKIAASIYNELKKTNQLIETFDILIAAQALSYFFKIATLNKDHFTRIPRIQILD
jgi:tRNA(fMet)-specific endonuclease VapC